MMFSVGPQTELWFREQLMPASVHPVPLQTVIDTLMQVIAHAHISRGFGLHQRDAIGIARCTWDAG